MHRKMIKRFNKPIKEIEYSKVLLYSIVFLVGFSLGKYLDRRKIKW